VAFLSMNAEDTEANLTAILSAYYSHYKSTATSLGLRSEPGS
jgi:hypothetical protein